MQGHEHTYQRSYPLRYNLKGPTGDIQNVLDQQHFCTGQGDGENQADADFKNHTELNDNPLTAQDQTKQYSEGYKIGYDDDLNILIHG